MKKIQATEILDLGAYETLRTKFRDRIIALKKTRRITVGGHLTFVFENRDTVLWQIQEMLRVERITAPKGVEHEIQTYNDLIPEHGALSATLMVEYDDKEERSRMLDALTNLKDHVFLTVLGRRTAAVFKPLPGEEEGRLPAVNYLQFELGEGAIEGLRDPAGTAYLEVTHPSYQASAPLSAALRRELSEDLTGAL